MRLKAENDTVIPETLLRLTPELDARLEAYAQRHGIPLLMAQKCLIAAGLDAEEQADRTRGGGPVD